MVTKAIRGATTVESNTPAAIRLGAMELIYEIITRNNITKENVIFVEFSATKDLNAVYPAKFIREEFGWNDTAFMCLQEMDVENSLPMCLRVLVVAEMSFEQIPQFVYIKGAENLRK